MTQSNNSQSQAPLSRKMLAGAVIGLAVISFFLLSVSNPDPAWGKFWMIRPLIIVPVAGAVGGLCNYLILQFHTLVGINKTKAWIVSILIFLVGLWLGVVLGLDGTLWD